MYEKLESCPSCNSKDFNPHLICDDHTVSKESFAIMKCINCNLLVTSPRPDQTQIGKYYESNDYISHTDKATNLTNFIYKIARYFTINSKYKLLSSLTKSQSILDYGCGTGHLLGKFQEKGWETLGIEPDEAANKIAQTENNISTLTNIDQLDSQKFSIISLWHVLEHVHEPSVLISKLHKHLKKSGYLILALPNPNSYDAKKYKEQWAAYDVPRHLFHYTPETITQLLTYNKFKLVQSKGMRLDAFYISLLSEKYKNRSNNLIKAFINGCISNRYAQNNENNYSSMIYIFQKS